MALVARMKPKSIMAAQGFNLGPEVRNAVRLTLSYVPRPCHNVEEFVHEISMDLINLSE